MRTHSAAASRTHAHDDDTRRRRRASLALGGGGGENNERYEGGDVEHAPRPLGVASGMAWEPRDPTRSFAAHSITWRFLEALEEAPWLQDIAVAAYRLVTPLFTRNDPKTPAEAAAEPGAG
jgi:hypothetical protein